MLLRLFDREDLQLIPSVEFAAPLPELEALRRGGGRTPKASSGSAPTATLVCDVAGPARAGLVLQRAPSARAAGDARRVAGIGQRYAQHPSFAGLGVRLSADGYAQLPGPEWGLDDATIAQFEHDAKLRVAGAGPPTFCRAIGLPRPGADRQEWLEWRAAQLGKFYRRVSTELAAIRPAVDSIWPGPACSAARRWKPNCGRRLPRRHDRCRGAAARGHRRPAVSRRPATDRALAA